MKFVNLIEAQEDNRRRLENWIQQTADAYEIDISKFQMDEILQGIKIEKEHDTNDEIDVVKSPSDLLKIAVAHLREDPHYYVKLKQAKL